MHPEKHALPSTETPPLSYPESTHNDVLEAISDTPAPVAGDPAYSFYIAKRFGMVVN